MRGMTVSCPGSGRIWGADDMTEALDELTGLGVEWVSIHPYAGIRRDGSIRFQPAADTGYLASAVARARRAGVSLFWKPHLAYWGSFDWRGSIDFGDDQVAWRRFFEDYRAFILDQARFAAEMGVPLFAVGVELEATTHHEAEWRQLVAEIREVFPGKLTYAANWDRLDRVPFWDALDQIGVQAYFPLAGDERPSREALWSGWDRHLADLEQLSEQLGKPVLFAEIGYDVWAGAAREPWQRGRGETEHGRDLRRMLLDIALERLEDVPFLAGIFWWKWIPGQRASRQDFSMRHPDAKESLRRFWGR